MSTVCPSCYTVEMRTVATGASQYETCDSCGGAFFDFGELAAEAKPAPDAVGTAEKIYRGDDLPDNPPMDMRICPRCEGIEMTEREYSHDSGIHVDACPNCFSVFLNAKELEEIRRYLSTYDRSDETETMKSKIPAAIATAQTNMMARVQEAQERDEKEYAEDAKGDWIPDFLQTGLRNRILDAFDMNVGDQIVDD